MLTALQTALRRCVYRLMRPLSRVLMQHGMAWGDFMEAARKAWVDEAFCQRQLTGKRATISSVSALTGLTRRETSRIRGEPIEGDSERDARYNRAARVVSGWVSDRRFHDASGEPRDLPMDAADGFADLVRTYSGDIPTVAMLRLLEASSTVTVEASMVRLAQRAYIPASTPVEQITMLGTDTGELIATMGHNFAAAPGQRVFQRKLHNPAVRPEALAEFRAMSSAESQALLERCHRWLAAHEVDPGDHRAIPVYVAMGIHYYDDSMDSDPEC